MAGADGGGKTGAAGIEMEAILMRAGERAAVGIGEGMDIDVFLGIITADRLPGESCPAEIIVLPMAHVVKLPAVPHCAFGSDTGFEERASGSDGSLQAAAHWSVHLFEIELATRCEANCGELVDERLIARVRFVDAHELRKIAEECGGVHSRHGLERRDPQ